jgi:hypothetical protein
VRAKKPLTVYDEAVQRVQEWNEALNGGSDIRQHPHLIISTTEPLPLLQY